MVDKKKYSEILHEIVHDKAKGLESLYNQYGQKWYSYAVNSMNLSPDEAWDTIYLTFDSILNKMEIKDFESQLHFDNTLYKIFINNLRQNYRKKKLKEEKIIFVSLDNELEIGDGEYISELDISDGSFEQFYKEEIENESIIKLQKALERLSKTEQDLLLMKAQNFTYDEIANFLGIENNQLKVSLFRAKKKLIKFYNDIRL